MAHATPYARRRRHDVFVTLLRAHRSGLRCKLHASIISRASMVNSCSSADFYYAHISYWPLIERRPAVSGQHKPRRHDMLAH